MQNSLLSQIQNGKKLKQVIPVQRDNKILNSSSKSEEKGINFELQNMLGSKFGNKSKKITPAFKNKSVLITKQEEYDFEDIPPPPPPEVFDSIEVKIPLEEGLTSDEEDNEEYILNSTEERVNTKRLESFAIDNFKFINNKVEMVLNVLHFKSACYVVLLFRSTNAIDNETISNLIRSYDHVSHNHVLKTLLQEDVFTLANGLKHYFKQEYPPHVPHSFFEKFVKLGSNQSICDEKLAKKLLPLIKQVIKSDLLKAVELQSLCKFINDIETTDCSMKAHIWGPILIRSRFATHDVNKIMSEQKAINRVVKMLIMNHKVLLSEEYFQKQLKKRSNKRFR